jgi:AhpD family alkylhydroperoxidase
MTGFEFNLAALAAAILYHAAHHDDAWPVYAEEDVMFDMAKLTKLKKLDEESSEAMKAFRAFDKAVFQEGTVSLLYKQLMAVAVALTTQCPYCIEIHTREARKAGATDDQLAETALVAAAIRAGGAVTHAAHLFD